MKNWIGSAPKNKNKNIFGAASGAKKDIFAFFSEVSTTVLRPSVIAFRSFRKLSGVILRQLHCLCHEKSSNLKGPKLLTLTYPNLIKPNHFVHSNVLYDLCLQRAVRITYSLFWGLLGLFYSRLLTLGLVSWRCTALGWESSEQCCAHISASCLGDCEQDSALIEKTSSLGSIALAQKNFWYYA